MFGSIKDFALEKLTNYDSLDLDNLFSLLQFSKVFGIMTDDSPRGKKQSTELLMNVKEDKKKPSTNPTAISSMTSNRPSPRSVEQFQPLPFTSMPVESSNKTNIAGSSKTRTAPNTQPYTSSRPESDSLLPKRTTVPSSSSSVLQPQKSSFPATSWSNSASLDSLMMKNAGIHTTSGRFAYHVTKAEKSFKRIRQKIPNCRKTAQ